MKRLLLFIALFISFSASAQRESNTMWPYTFLEFTPGEVCFKDGQRTEFQVNIHYVDSQLHYLKNGLIHHSEIGMISTVTAGGYEYVAVDNKLLSVEAKNEIGCVALLTTADLNKLNQAEGGYGTTSNTSTTSEYTLLQEIAGMVPNTPLKDVMTYIDRGRTLYLEEEYYFVVDGKSYRASKSAINRLLEGDQKKSFKKFTKENKIDWKDSQSMIKVVEFIKENIE